MKIPANISNEALSALVAEAHGWKRKIGGPLNKLWVWTHKNYDTRETVPPYAESLDAVLPLLVRGWGIRTFGNGFLSQVWKDGMPMPEVFAKTLARSLCLAILVAKGATIEGGDKV